jgi:hypothetical protein
MIPLRRLFILCIAVTVFSIELSGCATEQQVREIVTNTNVAMLSPYLELPGNTKSNGNDGWKNAIMDIDRLIAANPGQTTLVNHLRVRQAMLLTVNGQYNLAEQRWLDVDGSALTNERDKSLYENSETIVWWYRRAKIQEPLELDVARRHKQGLDPGIEALQDPSIRIYLATLQAQIALRLANDADVSDPLKQSEVARTMVTDLQQYVQHFSPEDQQWVINNPNRNMMAAETLMADFRNRVWLREMIRNYKITAQALELPPALAWKPDWITAPELN